MRSITREQVAELVNLYHTARTALGGDDCRYARMVWAAEHFAKTVPGLGTMGAYKHLARSLEDATYQGKTTPEEEGEDAGLDGRPKSGNPYRRGLAIGNAEAAALADDWDRGHDAGSAQRREELREKRLSASD